VTLGAVHVTLAVRPAGKVACATVVILGVELPGLRSAKRRIQGHVGHNVGHGDRTPLN
jgi:hypothetical protein